MHCDCDAGNSSVQAVISAGMQLRCLAASAQIMDADILYLSCLEQAFPNVNGTKRGMTLFQCLMKEPEQ